MARSRVMDFSCVLEIQKCKIRKTSVTLDLVIGFEDFLDLNNFSDNFRGSLSSTYVRQMAPLLRSSIAAFI